MRTLRIVTLNIWNRGGPWEQRLSAIRAGLVDLDPDIVGLQEVLRPTTAEAPDQARQIADGLGYHVAYGAAFDGGGFEFGNAALSKYPVVRTEVFALPKLDAPFGKVPFFVTHLSWRFSEGHVREAQVKTIAEHVKRLCPIEGFPPILVGDFNATPEADEIRYLKGLCSLGGRSVYFADTFGIAGRGEGTTFTSRNPFATDLREPDRRIDYIFVRGPDRQMRGEPMTARVVMDQVENGVFPTDHYGVLAEIKAR